jgi:hypothetical protein
MIHKSLGKRLRTELVGFQGNTAPAAMKALLSILDFRPCRTVLDPWAGHPAVAQTSNHQVRGWSPMTDGGPGPYNTSPGDPCVHHRPGQNGPGRGGDHPTPAPH